MQAYDIYKDISARTGGDIYIGVVGPVRTGKSTFIRRIMEQLVVPNIADANVRERAMDELPQSGKGRLIMTTQPKFVPNEAVDISLDDKASFRMRLVDCVGYLVNGAQGHMDEKGARMVRTPWFDHDIPFEQAAEVGTRKVIDEHACIAIAMTTDGSISDIPRENYIEAEERVVRELKSIGKPFVIVLNCTDVHSPRTIDLRRELEEKYETTVILMNATTFEMPEINELLSGILYEFPIRRINVNLSKWVCSLNPDHWLLGSILTKLRETTGLMQLMKDNSLISDAFVLQEYVKQANIEKINLGDGSIDLKLEMCEPLFYQILGEECGCEIKDDSHLMSIVGGLVEAKREMDRLAGALESVRRTG